MAAASSASKTRRAILVLFIWAVAMLFFMAALHPNGKLIDLVCIYTKEFTTTLKNSKVLFNLRKILALALL